VAVMALVPDTGMSSTEVTLGKLAEITLSISVSPLVVHVAARTCSNLCNASEWAASDCDDHSARLVDKMYPLIVAETTIATIMIETSVSISVVPLCRELAGSPIIFMNLITERLATGACSSSLMLGRVSKHHAVHQSQAILQAPSLP